MSLWSRAKARVKKALGIRDGAPPPKPPPAPKPPPPPPKPPGRPAPERPPIERPEPPSHGVDRDVPVANPAWSSVQDYMDRNLTDRGVSAFDAEQLHLAALFDIVADPQQSEHIKRDAYEELENRLAEFGFLFRGGINSSSDFDWAEFKNHYPVLD